MLAISFTFLTGRYHATPWGRHVNEADVAWPPDLWRISRALVAVWHRKLDPVVYPVAQLHALLADIAQAPAPSYSLPDIAIHSHTRHYMPGKADKKTLVFDAFAHVASDAALVIAWPGLVLEAPQLRLLDALLAQLGYLGRAESWVDSRRIDDVVGAVNCVPIGPHADDGAGAAHGEIVRLMAPLPPASYAALRLEKFGSAGIALDPQGAPQPAALLPQKRLLATLPGDWLAAIGVDTGELQSAGWSAPPCAMTLSYRRPPHSLQATATRRTAWQRPDISGQETTARFALYGKPLPRLEEAVRVGELVRRAAMGLARRMLGADALPPQLSGHQLDQTNRHGHAFWLPEDADADGTIDHVLVHAAHGLGADFQRVLMALQTVQRDGAEPLRMVLEGIGPSAQFGDVSRNAQAAAVWRSVTPYLHPWHMKKPEQRSSESMLAAVAKQLRREWSARGSGLPPIESVIERHAAVAGGRRLEPVHFRRFRQKRGLVQPDRLGRMLELRFSAPVHGPVALGFGCHFGLGLFEACAEGDSPQVAR